MMQFTVIIWIVFVQNALGISITFDPEKPAEGENVTISCKRSSASTASISWVLDSSGLTTCVTSADDTCIPPPTGYTVSTDVSANVFNLSLADVQLVDCKTYTCTDAVTASDTDSQELSVAKFDPSETVLTEPGAFRSGTISLTTGCVLSPSDVTISWKKVKDGVEYDVELATSKSTDATGCTDTCHSATSEKVIFTYVHQEYNESDSEQVYFRPYISHSSYRPDQRSVMDSAKYTVKAQTPGSFPIWIIIVIIVCCLFMGGIVAGVFMYYVDKDWNKIFIPDCHKTPPLVWLLCIVIIGFGILIVFLVKHFSGILNSKNKKTSPSGSKTEKSGKPQPPHDEVKQDLVSGETKHTVHIEEGSAVHTKKNQPLKLKKLDEAGSEKHHLSGRPLPQIQTEEKNKN